MAAHSGPEIVTDGLVLYLDAANSKSYNPNLIEYSEKFDNAYWSKNSGIVLVSTNEFAPNGKQTATTLEDTSTTLYQSISRSITVPNDSQIYSLSIFVRKTSGGTAPGFAVNTGLSGGTQVASNQRLNTDTGVVTSASVLDLGNYWRMHWTITNNSSGNTSLGVSIFPAARLSSGGGDTVTAIGTATIWGMMIARGSTLLDYVSNEGRSSNIWYDLSGQGNTGTLVNVPVFDSNNQGSFSFNGVNNSIDVGSISNFFPTYNDSVTYEIWSYTPANAQWHADPPGGSGTNIISRGTYPGFNGLGRLSTNNVVAAFYRGSTSGTASASFTITRDKWYHLVSIWTGTRAELYVDGQLRNTSTVSLVGNPTSGGVFIARQRALGGNTGGWYQGLLNGAKIYNRALATAEVEQNFAASRSRFGI